MLIGLQENENWKKIKAINQFYNSINNPKMNKTLTATAISIRTVPSFGENTIC